MDFFKKHTKALFLVLIVLYFISRLVNLTEPPILNDESTYIRYGLHQIKEDDHAFYSLLIGKEPFAPYVMALLGIIFSDPVLGARIASVIAGSITLIGLYVLASSLKGRRAGFIAMGIYIINPFSLFYDRLGYIDSWVSVISVWSLFFLTLLLQKQQRRYAVFLGSTLGFGLWVKSSTLFFIGLSFVIICMYLFSKRRERDEVVLVLKNTVLIFAIAALIFAPLYFSPLYPVHKELMKQYTYPLGSFFTFPLPIWQGNFLNLVMWLFAYITPPIFILALWGVWKRRNDYALFLWLLLPLLYEILFAKLFASRHALLLTIPLILYASFAVSDLSKNRGRFLLAIISLFPIALFLNWFIVISPHSLGRVAWEIPRNDLSYGSGFASGYGVAEAIAYLEEKAEEKQILVLIRSDTGNPEDAVVAFLGYHPGVQVVSMGNAERDWPEIAKLIPEGIDVYYVTRGAYYEGVEKYIGEEIKFMKPGEEEFVGVSKMLRTPEDTSR